MAQIMVITSVCRKVRWNHPRYIVFMIIIVCVSFKRKTLFFFSKNSKISFYLCQFLVCVCNMQSIDILLCLCCGVHVKECQRVFCLKFLWSIFFLFATLNMKTLFATIYKKNFTYCFLSIGCEKPLVICCSMVNFCRSIYSE